MPVASRVRVVVRRWRGIVVRSASQVDGGDAEVQQEKTGLEERRLRAKRQAPVRALRHARGLAARFSCRSVDRGIRLLHIPGRVRDRRSLAVHSARRVTDRRRRGAVRMAGLLAALVALGLGLAACGSGSPKASTTSSGNLMADALNYAGCMRSHGLTNFPDPTAGSSGLPSFSFNVGGDDGLNVNSPQYLSARKACEKDLPNLGGQTPADKAAANTKALKYVKCMRSNGEPDYPDPNGRGVIPMITDATGILDPGSPQFQKAEKACQSLDNGFSSGGAASSGSG
jgi:hypothetical protein